LRISRKTPKGTGYSCAHSLNKEIRAGNSELKENAVVARTGSAYASSLGVCALEPAPAGYAEKRVRDRTVECRFKMPNSFAEVVRRYPSDFHGSVRAFLSNEGGQKQGKNWPVGKIG
jgi:hypothetical protein